MKQAAKFMKDLLNRPRVRFYIVAFILLTVLLILESLRWVRPNLAF